MDAKESTLHSFLSQQIIMNVPIYQRKYNWSSDECKQLFNDILAIGGDESKKSYFIGSIVFKKEESDQIGGPDNVVLIDGQQRITSITLIYCALCDYYKQRDANLCNYYHNNFLRNNDIDNSYKLNLTKDDDFTLKRIIQSITIDKEFELKDEDALNLYTNYEIFKKLINEDNIEIIKNGLNKLVFISVGLGSDDNPQLIFESLNSTGLELKKNDLIRNFILMGLDSQHQNELYNNYWYEIEQGFKNEDALFDDFIRYYLAVKRGKLPTKYNIYKDFKTYSREFECIDDLVKDIYKFSRYFFNILFEKEEDPELLEVFKSLNDLEFNVTMPFILSLYDDYKNPDNNPDINLTKDDFIEIVKYVESYLLRRSICEIPTNSLNKVFVRLSREIDKSDYLNYFKAVIAEKDGARRFPTDVEVGENILIKNLYSKRKILSHILINIENNGSKAIVNIDECTLEHIMPQNLSSDWINELGDNYEEIHEKYLHTLGNLTLTLYNSEMSNKSFNEKKTIDGGFIDSKLDLNKKIAQMDSWGGEEIENRSKDLTNEITKIWKYPGKTEEITEIIETIDETEDFEDYTLDDFTDLEERTLPRQLADSLNLMILNIDSSIKQNVRKTYIAFSNKNKNFAEIIPQKKGLKIILDIPITELNDPKQLCDDVFNIGGGGTGDTRIFLNDEKDVNYVMNLIKQSYEYNLNQGFELKRVQDIIDDNEKCKYISCAIKKLEKLYNHPDVIKTIEIEAEKIYNGALENKALKGNTIELGVATSLYMSCRIAHAPFSKDEIATIYGVKSKLVMKLSKKLSNVLGIELPFSYPKDYLSRYCEILELSGDVEDRARAMCDEVENKGLRKGKSPTTVAASVLYLSSVQMGEKRTQGDIGEMVGISEVVIRNYCKLLREELDNLS